MLVFSKIRTEQNLDKIGIPNKYASAIDSELASNGWMTLTKSGPILNPSGRAHLAKLELSNPKQPHERNLEFLKPHGIGSFVNINPILSEMFSVTDKHDTSKGYKWLDSTIIKASIKTPGLDLLKQDESKTTNHTIINTGTLIQNSPITHSSVSTYLDESRPIVMPSHATTNKSQNSFWIKTFKWIGNHIVQILIALLVAYIVYRFGWT